jgi:protein-S-isoprenylcysteine O-methyltransferase Ste14
VSAPAAVTLACWAALELVVRVRESARGKGGRASDRGTRAWIAAAIAVAIFIAARASSADIPSALRAAGLVLMWLGLAIRGWAIAALGAAFRTTVEVDPGQAVVSTGPYRWIRHPSYVGLLLILAGFGLAAGSWLGLAACLVLPPPALVRRIQVEEIELERVLGEPYRAYQARTARLIPGLW